MKARELFRNYRSSRLEIRRLESDTCYRVDTVIGSTTESPYTSHPVTIRGVDVLQLKANQAKLAQLKKQVKYVEDAVKTAPNSHTSLILQLWTFDGLTWDKVAAVLTTEGIEASEGSVKQTAYRYFSDLDAKKPYKE